MQAVRRCRVTCSFARLSRFSSLGLVTHQYSTRVRDPAVIFHKETKWMQRERAAAAEEHSNDPFYLRVEVARRLCDRLQDFLRHKFPRVLELGCGLTLPYLLEDPKFGIEKIVQIDPSPLLLSQQKEFFQTQNTKVKLEQVVEKGETLPFEKESFDLVISNLFLHWTNDLPGMFAQIRHVLKPDGVVLASMYGEDTLWELRNSFLLAEQEREGGIGNHISPFVGVGDMGDLLSKSKFTLPTVDQEEIVVNYADPFVLMRDLRAMGDSNCLAGRRPYTPRDTMYAAAAAYKAMYGKKTESGEDAVPATYNIVYMIAWTHHPSQQVPLERGSAEVNMKQFFEDVGELKTITPGEGEKPDEKDKT